MNRILPQVSRPLRAFILAIVPGASLFGATIEVQAVSNGASFVQNAVAPGSIASIFGTGLAPSISEASGLPLPMNLNGVTVTVNGTAAPLIYVNPLQINFQVPSGVAAGQVSVVVSWGGASSAQFMATVMQAAPGIFKAGSTSQAAAQNAVDGSANDSNHPVAAGAVLTAYLTGQGPLDHPVPDGQPASSSPLSNATLPHSATVGGQSADILFLGLAPNFVGLLQANVRIPSGLASGDYPLVITIGGVASNAAMVYVSGGPAGAPQFSLLGSAAVQGGGVKNIAVNGNTAYACTSTEIAVVDITNSASPKVVEDFAQGDLNGNGIICALLGNSLIEVVNRQSLFVYDVSSPQNPKSLAGPISPPSPFSGYVFFSGKTGFFTTDSFDFNLGSNQIFAQHGEFFAYDFSNPASPAFQSSLAVDPAQPASSDASPRFGGVALNSSTALVLATTSTGGDPSGGEAQIQVIDISKPSSMVATGQVLIPQSTIVTAVAVQNNLALIAGNTKSWRNPGIPNFDFTGVLTLSAVDVSNPSSPSVASTLVSSIQTNFNAGQIIAPLGHGFFALAISPPATNNSTNTPPGEGQLAIVDARDPQNLKLTTLSSVTGLAGIAVSGGKLFAGTSTGMNIYQIH